MVKLLIVAPLPPPIGGATRNIELFLAEAAKIDGLEVAVVNTSPGDYRKGTSFLRLDTLTRFLRIILGFWREVGGCDAVLLFGRPSLIFSLGSALQLLNVWYQKRFFVKPFGGDFHKALAKNRFSAHLIGILGRVEQLFPETKVMTASLREQGLVNVSYVPNFRPQVDLAPAFSRVSERGERPERPVKFLFVSQIKAEKGIFYLLEGVRILAAEEEPTPFICEIYGPIFPEDRPEFEAQLKITPHATYAGVLELADILPTMSQYDVFVFPSYHANEGHPGVVIEAMQVGLPVISSRFKTIEELIGSGENGLLVPQRDAQALAEAMSTLAADPAMREQMGRANYARRGAFDAAVVIPDMIAKIFPQLFG